MLLQKTPNEKEPVRMITGEEAVKYQKQLEENYVYKNRSFLAYPFLELRILVYKFLGKSEGYFIIRHRYNSFDRRLLDMLFISNYEGLLDDEPVVPSSIDTLRYKLLVRVYRRELKHKHKWIRVTARNNINPKFIWHEDLDKWRSNSI